ncbi:hypothetical protein EJB05_12041, partial [Eragrostis curvula]
MALAHFLVFLLLGTMPLLFSSAEIDSDVVISRLYCGPNNFLRCIFDVGAHEHVSVWEKGIQNRSNSGSPLGVKTMKTGKTPDKCKFLNLNELKMSLFMKTSSPLEPDRNVIDVFLAYLTEAGEVGVNYGRVADNLPDPAKVTQLLRDNGITMIRIYDTNSEVLTSLANTGIKVMVMMPNEDIAAAAADPSYALQWVKKNVAAYHPTTQIHGIAVGNEVFKWRPELNLRLVPAMTNVQAALTRLGLADAMKVSTPIAFDALKESFPPSAGRFKDDIAQPVMKPMLDFLQRTGSYLSVNIYPFFTYVNQQPGTIPLDYALGNPNPGVLDSHTGLVYYNLLDAELDAMYHAMEALGRQTGARALKASARSAGPARGVVVKISENGWSSKGKVNKGMPRSRKLLDAGDAASIANAQSYNNNLIKRILSGNTGTPYRPDANLDVYIFSLFNEDKKSADPDDTENHFGLFYPNMQKVYEFTPSVFKLLSPLTFIFTFDRSSYSK